VASDLALALAAIPNLARDVRDAHVATPDGRCGVCSAGPQAGHVRHPCRLHDVAVAALAQISECRGHG
jgi:hypothetical protein